MKEFLERPSMPKNYEVKYRGCFFFNTSVNLTHTGKILKQRGKRIYQLG